ncbi:hypothetical protein DLM78_17925 [Leptospira stimsonii]|uniref:Uncharacterized protein n=1 Tax=Leptospira stimsonii TaxID=2202203 RepID=A0A8B3CQH4_9LEPT|nr:hypothetical protein DLM78_17925 [Leptospira stimsonii]
METRNRSISFRIYTFVIFLILYGRSFHKASHFFTFWNRILLTFELFLESDFRIFGFFLLKSGILSLKKWMKSSSP